jgi:NitT/TauT family transport system substrate-binding protein
MHESRAAALRERLRARSHASRKQTDFILSRTDSLVEMGYIKKKPALAAIDWGPLEEVIKENADLYSKLKYKAA